MALSLSRRAVLVLLVLMGTFTLTPHGVSAISPTNVLVDPSFDDTSSTAWTPLAEINNGSVTAHSNVRSHSGTYSAQLSAVNSLLTCPVSECKDSVRAEIRQVFSGTNTTVSRLVNSGDSLSMWWYLGPSSLPVYSFHFQLGFSDGSLVEYWYGQSDLSNASLTSRVFNLGPMPSPGSWYQTQRNVTSDVHGLIANPSSTRLIGIWFGAFGGTFNSTPRGETVWVDDAALIFDVPPSYPVAAFSSTVSAGYAPLEVQFDASSSHESNGAGISITTYTWTFGDGSQPLNVSSPTTIHTFSDPGTFTVTLTVFDTNNLKSLPTSTTITVNTLQSLSLPLIVGAGLLGLIVGLLVFRARRRSSRKARGRR